MDTVLRSRSASVTIGPEQPFCVIGERINPTGRKAFAEELRGGDLSTVTADALAQVQAGADMLDINAGIPLVDESELLKSMLRTAQDAVDVPICIDSSVIEALEAGLSVYEGRALVNSVTAEDERLEEILPLVARYDAAVIGLANDETGIPETPQKRLECARKIVSVANDHGIETQDVIIDPLAMTVGAATDAVTITLAHITFCMAYVTVVVQSRLVGFDESLEEAAMDLGARPMKVFFRITLPLIVPALVSGWLLAFTLSWDDLVISQFVAGPGSSTLPMARSVALS